LGGKTTTGHIGLLWAIVFLMVGLTLVVHLFAPYADTLEFLIRGTALLAYQLVFLAIVMSAFVKHLRRIFGRSFLALHHIVTIAGLGLMVLHGVGVAVRAGSAAVFVPVLSPWEALWRLGGRPALYLFLVAALAAVFHRRIGNVWRVLHGLAYAAFLFATVHGILIGTSFQFAVVRGVALAMLAAVAGVFVQRRFAQARRNRS